MTQPINVDPDQVRAASAQLASDADTAAANTDTKLEASDPRFAAISQDAADESRHAMSAVGDQADNAHQAATALEQADEEGGVHVNTTAEEGGADAGEPAPRPGEEGEGVEEDAEKNNTEETKPTHNNEQPAAHTTTPPVQEEQKTPRVETQPSSSNDTVAQDQALAQEKQQQQQQAAQEQAEKQQQAQQQAQEQAQQQQERQQEAAQLRQEAMQQAQQQQQEQAQQQAQQQQEMQQRQAEQQQAAQQQAMQQQQAAMDAAQRQQEIAEQQAQIREQMRQQAQQGAYTAPTPQAAGSDVVAPHTQYENGIDHSSDTIYGLLKESGDPDKIHLTDEQMRELADYLADQQSDIDADPDMDVEEHSVDLSGVDGDSDFSNRVQDVAEEVVDDNIPYAWGGGSLDGPSQGTSDGGGAADANGDYAKQGFDCSGFSRYVVYQTTGVEIPRVAAAQYDYCDPVDEPQVGDLGFPPGGNPGHVVVYMGDGQIAEAPQSGETVHFRDVSDGEFVWGRVPAVEDIREGEDSGDRKSVV